ncbi:DNA repair protein RecN [Nocardia cyriacigeorgica]|uniref:DNA repair protein RecN n=2 Tax=Nocardia cyriacigeorgica TaxID=135487 RepID=H6R0Z7_NOCCG|nr:DNA repair protein RecN [Nocardia cyriacigeorgica]MBF6084634.1 DNA repair protein RecN [Nocardia cyriacigeorgica]MBF6289419.1 DNA repair protein RecN [Nocardia cyriacigeorgica]MBF6428208.1 DNA repair protein RecN [Nocardia cyriacigeorgica]NEW34445.1 DNA repair protein RecN [Nocardia cyriacigeorgica]CCF62969.1 recombination and repair protein [Nocardia cyriacigeorgica GUH-2]
MLTEIRIDGLGVISTATAQFHEGLTVLTGETGAGKTMVVTSLHLLSGARADAGRVRLGASRAVVEGRFTIDEVNEAARAEVAEVLEAAAAERDDDGSVIAIRTVGSDGRSRAHLGGRGVPASVLSDFTAPLLTVHGQNDQLRLQRPDQQLSALDQFAADTVGPLLRKYQQHRRAWLDARTELLERTAHSRELALEADRLKHSLAEIDAIAPEPGEDERLVAEIRRLSDLDSLREAAATAHDALAGPADSPETNAGALDALGTARSRLESAEDPALAALAPRLGEAIAVVVDLTTELSGYLSDLPSDPGALDSMLTRQAELKTLTRKYAPDIDGVIAWAEESRTRLESLDVSEETLASLAKEVEVAADKVRAAASKLTAARTKAAGKLAEAVSAELGGLAMGKARLEVVVRPVPAAPQDSAPLTIGDTELHAGSSGVDEVEFRLSAHSGAQSLPLSKSASGGELSRVMLALEVVLAGSEHGATMVFDEVDAGVGGRAAVEIGRRLARLARTHQVIVVTHLPQVAAFADTHLVVNKSDDGDGAVNSGVRALTNDERVIELARMLAGLDDTETGRAHAEELLQIARSERATAR